MNTQKNCDRVRWNRANEERLFAIRRAMLLIGQAGAGAQQRQITRDAGLFAPRDNDLYVAYVEARLEALAEAKGKLLPNADWPAGVYVPQIGALRGDCGD